MLEYILITCFAKVFPVFSPFLLSLRCLYSAYVLVIVSSLTFYTFACVHFLRRTCGLPLLRAPFKYSRFLCCSMPSLGKSTVSQKNLSCFNICSPSAMTFIRRRNRHHMKNNIKYKGNTNSTPVIILFHFTLVLLAELQAIIFLWLSLTPRQLL